MDNLIISPSPHVHSGDTVSSKMYGVFIALIPAFIASLYFFGIGALIISVTAVLSCVVFEYLIQRFILRGSITIMDGSAALTGILLAFNLPSNLPVWQVIAGAFVAIGVAKMSFGGLGNNPFNPALIARVFLLISFPAQMTSWPLPIPWNPDYLDAVTAATPLAILKGQFSEVPNTLNLFLGNVGGSLGEVSALAILIGLAYLLIRKIITWHIPVSILATVAIFTGILHFANPDAYIGTPQFHLLTGGIMLGAVFMATDYVTSPMTPRGMLIYGVGIGIITVVIRVFGFYPEGVSFAILIMNAFTPLINKFIKPKRFGEVKKV